MLACLAINFVLNQFYYILKLKSCQCFSIKCILVTINLVITKGISLLLQNDVDCFNIMYTVESYTLFEPLRRLSEHY